MFKLLSRIVGDSNEKEIKRLLKTVDEINGLEPEFEALSDAERAAKTAEFKERLAEGETLDDLLPEAFAAVRETAKRVIGQRHFDVQLMGGMVLHSGRIAEMKTGEGKTLVATLPTYLNALNGRGVHVITVNDYLARRDAQWMGAIYHALGLSVATIQHDASFLYDPEYEPEDPRFNRLRPITRYEAYRADITYGTNNEFGFDYLRDNMVIDLSQKVQRELVYAIVDEVDNILIDEARTPLIISGQAEEATDNYEKFARLIPRLNGETDYTVDEKLRTAALTEEGIAKMERWLNLPNLYDPSHYQLTHYLDNALKAHVLYKRDKDYIVKDGEVIIVDEFTGRMMPGRRWSDGLHQAVEAKERVPIQRENVTLATITFQNYFRMYEKLAGMTGTAVTEAEELHKIYKLDVVVVPTNRPMVREDHGDQVFKTEHAKFEAVVREIKDMNEQGRPVLVGTTSVEKSEYLSTLLMRQGIEHQVLNAKLHEKEAGIVAEAGRPGAVTIATNMAGRGTDIKLDPEVIEQGGLHIIGTERHEARRIDNQLRGRAGRQGDPGSSRFFVSLEDDIMRRFGGDRIKGFMDRFGMEDDVPIEHGMVSKAIEQAQTKVEGYNFDLRKHVVEYDDVMNKQREIIYAERNKILSGADLKANVQEMIHDAIEQLVEAHLPDEAGDHWDSEMLVRGLAALLPAPLPEDLTADNIARMSKSEAHDYLIETADEIYEQREGEMGSEDMRILERLVMLRIIDNLWVEHLTAMDTMREGIGLRAIGQNDPLVAYKTEAHRLFSGLQANIRNQIAHTIYHVNLVRQAPPPPPQEAKTNREPDDHPEGSRAPARGARAGRDGRNGNGAGASRQKVPVGAGASKKIGRNDPCFCGSGRKYKKCHGTET